MILFADDVLLVTEEEKDMEKKLEALGKAMEKWDMKVHWGEDKGNEDKQEGGKMQCESKWKRCERVEANEVLGNNDECEPTYEEENEHRIGAATRVIGAVRTEILERRELRKESKMKMLMQWW